MKKLLFSLFVLLPTLASGQSASMLSMAQSELQKRGLNETEVRARLLEDGIDVDNISPAEYANYQGRVMEVLNKMQSEKAKALAAQTGDSTAVIELAAKDIPATTISEADAEAIVANTVAEPVVSKIYGHSIFTENTLDVYRTTDGAQAPDTYVLGEGDEIHISIFGSSQTEIHQRIGADGAIQPAGSSKIFLKGMTLGKAREAVRTKLASHYSFREDQIAVTISTARTLQVSIYGEVGVQGGFTVSALNTAFNALAAAGGPTEIGSVRNIQLSRAGKSSKLDLYAYMMKPDSKASYDLQNGDVLYVPVADKIVSIEGAVNRPMSYEILQNETLADLVKYAGGLTFNAADFVQIERHENGEINYMEYELKNVTSGKQKVSLANGDVVRIRTANKPMENYVKIMGGVYYEGSYDLAKNGTLKALLENAKPKYTAKTDFVFVERLYPDETSEVMTVPFDADFKLQARDIVRVSEQSWYRDVDSIKVSGEVRLPFEREYGLNDKITVSQAIEMANGLKTNVFPVAYIFRKDLTTPGKMNYIRINLESDGYQLLQAGDELNIYDNTTYANIGEVRVSGAVKSPFGTAFDESLSLHDLLVMAGGFEVGAAYDRVEIFRMNISKKDEAKLDLITIEVDEDYNPINSDFQLQPYDNIVVRMTPNFVKGGRTVEINGRVKYPGVYILEDNKTQLWEIIKLAGGLLDDADPYARLFRTYNNRGNIGLDLRTVKSNKGNVKSDPVLMDGDVIDIVRLENTVVIRETGTRMSQYVPEDYSASQKLIVYQGNHSAKWYIKHYAGGFQKLADRNSVTVTFPNNQTESTKKVLGFIRKYPTVEPGGVVTMRLDDKKREKLETPKEKINWGNTLNQSVSTLTSVFSLIILVDRLK